MGLFRWLFFNLIYLLQRPRWDTGISPPELLAFLDGRAPGRALDFGCGTGLNVLAMAQAGWQVTGVDFSIPAVAAARRRLKDAGVDAEIRLQSVIDRRGLAGPYDLIFDVGCYFGLPEAEKILYERNLTHLLAPGGIFLAYMHLRRPGETSGATEEEIARLGQRLNLQRRVDGVEGPRASAWFWFVRP